MATRTVDMLEDGRLVVRHIFHGRDDAEAKHMEQAHLKADASLRAALAGKPYKGVEIEAKRRPSTEPGFKITRKFRAPRPGDESGLA